MTGSYLADSHKDVLIEKEVEAELKARMEVQKKDFEIVKTGSTEAVSYPVYRGVMQRLPNQTVRHLGCANCDWRGGPLCPHGFKVGHGNTLKKNSLPEGICRPRSAWLKSFYRGSKPIPTYTEFIHDYNQGLAQLQMQADFQRLKVIEEKLGSVEERLKKKAENIAAESVDDSDVEFMALEKLRNQHRTEWFFLWKELMAADAKRLDRDAVRKIDITRRDVTPADVGNLIREATAKVVDVEEDEDDDEKEA